MPAKFTYDVAQAVAQEYISNGFIKSAALETVGYSHNYANNAGLRLFADDRMKAAISVLQGVRDDEAVFTQGQARAEHNEARLMARTMKRPDIMINATRAKAKLYGLEADRIVVEDGSGRKPPTLEEAKSLSEAKRKAVVSKVIGENNG